MSLWQRYELEGGAHSSATSWKVERTALLRAGRWSAQLCYELEGGAHSSATSWKVERRALLRAGRWSALLCYELEGGAHSSATSWKVERTALLRAGRWSALLCYELEGGAHSSATSWKVELTALLRAGRWSAQLCYELEGGAHSSATSWKVELTALLRAGSPSHKCKITLFIIMTGGTHPMHMQIEMSIIQTPCSTGALLLFPIQEVRNGELLGPDLELLTSTDQGPAASWEDSCLIDSETYGSSLHAWGPSTPGGLGAWGPSPTATSPGPLTQPPEPLCGDAGPRPSDKTPIREKGEISRSAGRGSVCFRLRCVSGWRFFVLHYSDSTRRYSAEPGQRSRSEGALGGWMCTGGTLRTGPTWWERWEDGCWDFTK
ncbi:unnamed protein product [Arctogadus glacialis]